MKKHEKMIHYLCLLGVLSLPVYLLHDILGAYYYPGYDWMSQAVSDLTATNSPSYVIASTFSSLYALLASTSSILVCFLVQKKRNKTFRIGIYLFTIMNLISALGYALFPLSESGYAGTFQDVVHVYVITSLVVVLSILSLILIFIGGRKATNEYRFLSSVALITLTFMLLGPIGMSIVPKDYFGVVERFSVYSAVIFNAALGYFGFRMNGTRNQSL